MGAPLPHTPAARGIQAGTRIQRAAFTDLLTAALPPGMLQPEMLFSAVHEEIDGVRLSFQVCSWPTSASIMLICIRKLAGLWATWLLHNHALCIVRLYNSCAVKVTGWFAGCRGSQGKAGGGRRGCSSICSEDSRARAALGAWEDCPHTQGSTWQGGLHTDATESDWRNLPLLLRLPCRSFPLLQWGTQLLRCLGVLTSFMAASSLPLHAFAVLNQGMQLAPAIPAGQCRGDSGAGIQLVRAWLDACCLQSLCCGHGADSGSPAGALVVTFSTLLCWLLSKHLLLTDCACLT